jgi:hypothetical protein
MEMYSSNGAITRPTEAQLKWALLNHRRVALAVQSYVRRLYLYPASLQDVPGGLAEVDLLDDPCEIAGGRTNIQMSQGRRALLRVSQRAYEQRKLQIIKCGFKYHRSCSDCESDDSSCCSCDSDVQQASRRSTEAETAAHIQNQSIAHGTTHIPVASTVRRKRFRQRRRKFQPRCSDPERVRRFKQAFQAALHALEMATNQDQFQVSPSSSPGTAGMPLNSKRRTWTRPNADSASRFPDDAYSVWGCSTVIKRQPSVHNPTMTPGKAPLDRGATWLQLLNVGSGVKNHTPRRDSLSTPLGGGSPANLCSADRAKAILTPALRQHVAEVAREIFSGDRNPSKADPRRSLSPSLDTLERDVSSFVEQFEQHIASVMVETVISSDSSRVYTPSLRHSDFGMDVRTPLVSVLPDDGIAPVVTYDSDDGIENTALDESAISHNPYETFSIQILDNSFSCWNASSTEMVNNCDKQVVFPRSATDFDTIEVNGNSSNVVQRDTSVALCSHLAAEDVFKSEVEVLEMSPMNFKRILQLLPDHRDLGTQVVANVRPQSTMESRQDEESLHHSPSQPTRMSWVKDHDILTVSSPLANVLRRSVRRVDHRVVLEGTAGPGVWTAGISTMTPIPGNSSAGCGLYSERASHFNVRWEKQWML